MLPRVRLARAAAVIGIAAVLAGCTAAPAPQPSATATGDPRECAEAAAGIVAAADALVVSYERPAEGSTGTDDATGDPLSDAVESARDTRQRLGCDPKAFDAALEQGLAGIAPDGAIAAAVLRRVSAS